MCLKWFIFCTCCMDNLDPPVQQVSYVWNCKDCQVLSDLDFNWLTVSLCNFCDTQCRQHTSSYCQRPGPRKKKLYKMLLHQWKYPSTQMKYHDTLKTTLLDRTCFANIHAYIYEDDIYLFNFD